MLKHLLYLGYAVFFSLSLHAQNIPITVTATPDAPTSKKLPPAYNTVPGSNYLRVYVPQVPRTDVSQISMSSPVEDVLVTTSFYDSYGRAVESVSKQTSPAKKDNVSVSWYDEFGRESTQYLPYTATANDGGFKSNPFYQDSVFYNSQFPNEHINYAQILYDGSPLNIPVKTMAQGNSWGGAGVGVSYGHRANSVLDSVVLWTVAIVNEDDVPVKAGFYLPGTLSVKEVTDENGIKSVQYTNQAGQTVLTKTQLSNTPGTAHMGWLCNYYVYDEMGSLRMMIPPRAVEAINTNAFAWSLTVDANIQLNLCYSYFYDARGRNIMKRIPGKGKSYVAYDLHDRPVMTQDPNLRNSNQWAFVLYDSQGRPVKSGLITTALFKDSILAQAARSLSYATLTGSYTITSESFYDNYDWVAASGTSLTSTIDAGHINSTNFITSYDTAPHYAQQLAKSGRIKGAITGSKTLILKTSTYLYSLQIYDQYGRSIQSKQTNYSGGTDVATVQYSFAGRVLRSQLAHQKSGVNAQMHTVLTKYSYDHVGRLLSLVKNFDGLGDKTITEQQYNELGQASLKLISPFGGAGGGVLETQRYAYNIRGWLLGINPAHVQFPKPSSWFGEAISYDNGFVNNQLNGNKAGVKWRAAGDSIVRAYGYGYDNNNRLVNANYSQKNSGSTTFTKDKADFSVSNLSFDAHGNILSMSQRGLLIGNSALIDSLHYSYFNHSNRLQKVTELATAGGNLGDFKDSSFAGDDYTYDANGNINRDNNRHMHNDSNAGAVFNLLDKADSIVIAGKATTHYYYDASGNMLGKKVNSYTTAGLKVKNYQFLGGFVYLNDTLQYTMIEGGRIRYAQKQNSATGAAYYAYEYDYFVTDHMGNVRTVLTEGKDTAVYVATMEPARSAVEDALFANIYTPVQTVFSKPSGFDTVSVNTKVSMLDASVAVNKKSGPGLVLKVMKGDQVQINSFAFYNTTTQPPAPGVNLLQDILGMVTGGIVGSSGGKLNATNTTAVSNALSPHLTDFLSNDRDYDNSKPKAYLNWVLFDNQFNFIAGSSGVVQVQAGSTKQPLVAPLQTITKNGYLYVYVSNESPQPVYFDDLTVRHTTGPLLQEQAYYPYGLQMAGISDRAINKTGNPFKFNAGSELEDEDGLEYYNTFFRKYDAQIGRFTGIDMLAEEYAGLSPYHFGANNPAMFNDPTGLQHSPAYRDQNGNKWHNPGVLHGLSVGSRSFDWYKDYDLGYQEGGNSGRGSFFKGVFSQWATQGFAAEGRVWYSDRKQEGNFDAGDFPVMVYGKIENGLWNTSSVDWGGDGFGVGFTSANDAAENWTTTYGKYSIDNNTEVSSLVFEKRGRYFYTPGREWPSNGKYPRPTSSPGPKILFPMFANLLKASNTVGFIHSHGAYKKPTDEFFSTWSPGYPTDAKMDIYGAYKKDKNGIVENYPNLIMFLSTPSGNLYRRERESGMSNGNQVLIGSGFYRDPRLRN